MATKRAQAGAVIKVALERKNHQDCYELQERLEKRGLTPNYLKIGVRVLRDAYGEHAVVTVPGDERPVYVIDPDLDEGHNWSLRTAKRAKTESDHLLGVLDWLAGQFGNKGAIRSARRYCKNLVAELDEIVEALNGAE